MTPQPPARPDVDALEALAHRDFNYTPTMIWRGLLDCVDYIRHQDAELAAAKAHLTEMVDAVIWMSGSDDFATKGKGGTHWVKVRDEQLRPTMEWLATPEAS